MPINTRTSSDANVAFAGPARLQPGIDGVTKRSAEVLILATKAVGMMPSSSMMHDRRTSSSTFLERRFQPRQNKRHGSV